MKLLSLLLPLLSLPSAPKATAAAAADPLKGRHLRVAVIHNPPDVFVGYDPLTRRKGHGGPLVLALEWLSHRLKFTYEIVPLDSYVDAKTNKTVKINQGNGVEYFASRVDLDVMLPHVSLTPNRKKVVDFATPTASLLAGFVLPAAEVESYAWAPIKPFNSWVWLSIAVSIVVVALAIRLLSNTRRRFLVTDLFWVFAFLVGQGSFSLVDRQQRQFLMRFVMVTWALTGVLLYHSYNSILISWLTQPSLKPLPQNAFETLEWPDKHYVIIKNSFAEEMLMSATQEPLKALGDSLRRNPEYIVSNRQEAYELVRSGCCGYTELMPYVKAQVYQDYKLSGVCRFSLGDVISGYGYLAIVLKKNSPYTSAISLELLRLIESGLMDHWTKMYSSPRMPCLQKAKAKAKTRSLRLGDYRFAYTLLGIGGSAALVSFGLEQARHWRPPQPY